MFKRVDGTLVQADDHKPVEPHDDAQAELPSARTRFFAHRRDRSLSFPFIIKNEEGALGDSFKVKSKESQLLAFLHQHHASSLDIIDFGTSVRSSSALPKAKVSKSLEHLQAETPSQSEDDLALTECHAPKP
ncbi:hypothetical protein [Legionella worsleiensis]|uniref:Uncharacterized protein n=1 Tax=Legionella worsleiensis TaxID=45076 RepID=A0A0W1AH63_9GAMM|nr:hypothetical protein [Legionella worsleiensis]KTD80701.1 hypothetical protein Lwor_0944 [Legionella worsleiensis]STY32721.1 Uncharacterised protein [Legionella worsleiensis]